MSISQIQNGLTLSHLDRSKWNNG